MTLEFVNRDVRTFHSLRFTAFALARFSLLLAASAMIQPIFAEQNPPPQPPGPCQNTPTTVSNASAATPTNSNAGTAPHSAEPQKNITWSIGHPPERLRFPDNSVIQFSVSASDRELCDLRIAQSTLQDVTTFFQLETSQLHLCVDESHCDTQIDIPPNSTRRLEIRIDPRFHTPGIFTGEVALDIKDKPETQSFKLTVYSRTVCAMLIGAVVIALGLGLYFLVNMLLRRRIAIDDALLPAYQLRDTIDTLKARVDEASNLTQVPLTAISDALKFLDEQLTPDALANHLPSMAILPWSSGTAWMDGFKAYLTPLTDKTGALVVQVNSGVQVAVAYWTAFPGPVAVALGQINLLAPTVPNATTAQAQLAPILQTLYAAVNPPHVAILAPVLASAPSNVVARFFTLPPNTQTLQMRLFHNTLWVWWLVALIALASGFYSVVLENFWLWKLDGLHQVLLFGGWDSQWPEHNSINLPKRQ